MNDLKDVCFTFDSQNMGVVLHVQSYRQRNGSTVILAGICGCSVVDPRSEFIVQ